MALSNKPEYNAFLAEALSWHVLNEETLDIMARNPAGPVILETVLTSGNFDKQEKLSILSIFGRNLSFSASRVRESTLAVVRPLIDGGEPDLAIKAIQMLGQGFGDVGTDEVLSSLFQSTDEQLRREALSAYAPYLNPNNYRTVLDLIWDKDETVRRKALLMAQPYIDKSDFLILEKALEHPDAEIRSTVAKILDSR